MSYHTSAGGPRAGTSGAPKMYRGSQKRVDRIKWRRHTPLGFWIFALVVALLLIAGAAWLMRHPPQRSHHHAAVPGRARQPVVRR